MNRYSIKLAYDGTNYHGWQVQDNANSVQAEINSKLSLLLGQEINIVGCGRTDTGVHAREFFAHFDIEAVVDDCKQLTYRLNSFLPADIAIYGISVVDNTFHTRFSASLRTYKYYIARVKDPFSRRFAYYFQPELDIDAMNRAASWLMEYDDFTSFSKLHTQTTTNICKLTEARWEQQGAMFVFTISADRFLRNMVRSIVGTLIEIGRGKIEAEGIKDIVEAKDRGEAGYSVPAKGLFLHSVEY